MDIENLVKRVTSTRSLLKQGEKDLFSGDSLIELCTRLKQTCEYIVKINYDSIKAPNEYYVHRTIKNMAITYIAGKASPITKLEWEVNDIWISAFISTATTENIRVVFPVNGKHYIEFIDDEQYIKDKTSTLQWVNHFKSKYPNMMKDLVESIQTT